MKNLGHTLSATVLFTLLASLLFVHGSEFIRASVVLALLSGAIGQFLAQDDGRVAQTVAWYMCWGAIALTVVATIIFTI